MKINKILKSNNNIGIKKANNKIVRNQNIDKGNMDISKKLINSSIKKANNKIVRNQNINKGNIDISKKLINSSIKKANNKIVRNQNIGSLELRKLIKSNNEIEELGLNSIYYNLNNTSTIKKGVIKTYKLLNNTKRSYKLIRKKRITKKKIIKRSIDLGKQASKKFGNKLGNNILEGVKSNTNTEELGLNAIANNITYAKKSSIAIKKTYNYSKKSICLINKSFINTKNIFGNANRNLNKITKRKIFTKRNYSFSKDKKIVNKTNKKLRAISLYKKNLKNKTRYIPKKIIKEVFNPKKFVLSILRNPKMLIYIGVIVGFTVIFTTISNLFSSTLGTIAITVPNIENQDNWINDMNQIDQEENNKIHSGNYFKIKNSSLKTDWRDVISVFMAKYYNDPPNNNNSIEKTSVTGTYSEIINRIGQQFNVDPFLICAVIKQESDFNQNEISPVGAMGLMQLMKENCIEYGVINPFDPYQNIMGGTKQLAFLMKRYNGNLPLVLAGYNAGIGNVQKYGGVPPFRETQDYIVKVTAYYQAYKNGKALPSGDISGTISSINNNELRDIYYLFNETITKKDKYGDIVVTLIKHDIDYVMKKMNFTKDKIQFAKNMRKANLFKEVIENFDFKFKIDIPNGNDDIAIPIGITAEQLKDITIERTNKNRQAIIDTAIKLIGKVNYFWGGKSAKGWNDAWGNPTIVTAPGSKTTGTIIPYGLDCSGFVAWVYDTAGVTNKLQNGGTNYQWANSYKIRAEQAKPGDLVFNNDCSHVGIYLGKKNNGQNVFIECSPTGGVKISNWSKFTEYRRLFINFGDD